MITMSLAEVAAAVAGRLTGPTAGPVTGGVEFDSRRIGPGDLYVALPGERVDGHDFAAAALAAGAVGALTARPVDDVPAVVVDNVQAALGRLARAVLDRLPQLTVIGITGSSGKTSTKDLLAQVLAGSGPTVSPPGSFNNEIGHPYTVLRATDETRFLVLECSARGPGHIAALCRIAPPAVGVVLNVGTAHVGEFGSQAAIAQTKGELVEALPADGLAVLNADDPAVAAMAPRTAARVVTVGRAATADVRADRIALDSDGRAAFDLLTPAGDAHVRLGLYGGHHVANALAVAAVALHLGVGPAAVAERLSSARPVSRWRMEVTDRADGVRIVNDAYNANPESMAAALRALVAMAGTGRTWAVLGEMGELGFASAAAHEGLGRLARDLGVDRLLLVGGGSALAGVAVGAGRTGPAPEVDAVPDIAAAVDRLTASLAPGDVVLVKASRAAGLERLAAALLVPDAVPARPPAVGVAP